MAPDLFAAFAGREPNGLPHHRLATEADDAGNLVRPHFVVNENCWAPPICAMPCRVPRQPWHVIGSRGPHSRAVAYPAGRRCRSPRTAGLAPLRIVPLATIEGALAGEQVRRHHPSRYRQGDPIMKKLGMLGIIGGAALLTAAPFSLQWSQDEVSLPRANARTSRLMQPQRLEWRGGMSCGRPFDGRPQYSPPTMIDASRRQSD